MFIII
jgi:hypothetical protein